MVDVVVDPWTVVKTAVPISKYIASHSGDRKPMRRTGSSNVNRWEAFCPLHENTRTPAMSIDDDKGVWNCFGGCGGGTIIDFWLKEHGLDSNPGNNFKALESLAKELGLTLDTKPDNAVHASPTKLKKVVEKAVHNTVWWLDHSPSQEADLISEWIEDRGLFELKDESLMFGGLPSDVKSAVKVLTRNMDETQIAMLQETGLIYKGDYGLATSFSGRATLPIRDAAGACIGIAARTVPGVTKYKADSAKWINPTNSVIFNKSKILYGMEHLSDNPTGHVSVCEGYYDVAGIREGLTDEDTIPVAACGTSFSKDHLQLIKSAETITFIFDGDEAGYKALLKSLWVTQYHKSVNASILSVDDPFDLYVAGKPIPVHGIPMLEAVVNAAESIADGDMEKFDHLIGESLAHLTSRESRSRIIDRAAAIRGIPAAQYGRDVMVQRRQNTNSTNDSDSREWVTSKTAAGVVGTWFISQTPHVKNAIIASVNPEMIDDQLHILFPDISQADADFLIALFTEGTTSSKVRLNLDGDIHLVSTIQAMAQALWTEETSQEAVDVMLRASALRDRAMTRARDDDALELILIALECAETIASLG